MVESFRGCVDDRAFWYMRGLRDSGLSITDIAAKMKLHFSTVSRWLLADEPPQPRRGRNTPSAKKRQVKSRRAKVARLALETVVLKREKLSPVRKQVTTREYTQRKHESAREIARVLGVSESTVRRDLKAEGFKAMAVQHAPHLSADDKRARVAFCKAQLAAGPDALDILFSDEKWFDSQTRRNKKLYAQKRSQLPTTVSDQGAARLLVLGFISKTTKKVVVCEGSSMDTAAYKKLLEQRVPMLRRHRFMQDNAAPHKALLRKGFFKKHRVDVLADWPARSPDLNVIETLWARLSAQVKRRAPFGKEELTQFVNDAVAAVPQAEVRALAEEFTLRCKACVRARGDVVTRSLVLEEKARMRNRAK